MKSNSTITNKDIFYLKNIESNIMMNCRTLSQLKQLIRPVMIDGLQIKRKDD